MKKEDFHISPFNIFQQVHLVYMYNTVVDDYINTMKTSFYLSFDCLQAFFELQVYK